MSFEKIPSLLAELLAEVKRGNELMQKHYDRPTVAITETVSIGDKSVQTTAYAPTVAEAKAALPTPTISAESAGRPLTAAEAPAALNGVANVGNAPAPVTPAEPAPTPAVTEAVQAAPVEAVSASRSEATVDDAKQTLLDVSNKVGREAAVKLLGQFNAAKFPQLKAEDYAAFVAAGAAMLEGK